MQLKWIFTVPKNIPGGITHLRSPFKIDHMHMYDLNHNGNDDLKVVQEADLNDLRIDRNS